MASANYDRLFSDRDFHLSLQNNLRWLLVFITVPSVAGLFLAMIFNAEMVGGRFYKVSFFAPLVLSLPVIGLVWSFGCITHKRACFSWWQLGLVIPMPRSAFFLAVKPPSGR
ncbi:MAG UNVERIFIED_CONTAM: hypothetical protein LVT10_10100 [Anaerolineae bacterium]